jgi:hypothetical protein
LAIRSIFKVRAKDGRRVEAWDFAVAKDAKTLIAVFSRVVNNLVGESMEFGGCLHSSSVWAE